jgi:hypothetical protein
MPGQVSDRAARYHQRAEHFKSLAKMEQEPRARAQLLKVAADYVQLVDADPLKPSLSAIAARRGDRRSVSD